MAIFSDSFFPVYGPCVASTTRGRRSSSVVASYLRGSVCECGQGPGGVSQCTQIQTQQRKCIGIGSYVPEVEGELPQEVPEVPRGGLLVAEQRHLVLQQLFGVERGEVGVSHMRGSAQAGMLFRRPRRGPNPPAPLTTILPTTTRQPPHTGLHTQAGGTSIDVPTGWLLQWTLDGSSPTGVVGRGGAPDAAAAALGMVEFL